jgi:hypothetical protein
MDHLEESKARPQVNNPASELYADTWDKMPMYVGRLPAAVHAACFLPLLVVSSCSTFFFLWMLSAAKRS